MSEKYFTKFPKITYANTACLDITRRVTLDTSIAKSPSIYYSYALKTGTRPDIIAENYYQDSYLDWLLFLNNGIIDPYFDWYMSDYEFNKFIVKKYGSLEIAQKKINYYELNFVGSEIEITTNFYDNHLANVLKKYFTPIYSQNTKIIAYKRRTDNTIRNTNRLVKLSLNTAALNIGDVIDVKNNTNSAIVGGGEITFIDPTYIIVKNINGDLSVNNYINNKLITSSTILFENITDEEFAYWKAKSFYDVEFAKNENNKNIRILHSNYAIPVAENIRLALKS